MSCWRKRGILLLSRLIAVGLIGLSGAASGSGEGVERAMVRIPGGVAQPVGGTPVTIQPFLLDAYEVTNGQYQQFLEATGHAEPTFWRDARFNHPRQPVVGVSWDDAAAYCEWAGKRLPREGEWMLAARGPQPRLFPWGDTPPDDLLEGAVANYNAVVIPVTRYRHTSFVGKDGFHYPAPVGSFPGGASPSGVHDLAGNVSEWVSDALLPASEVDDPARGRVKKGGSWLTLQRALRIHAREWSRPELATSFSTGFRCAADR